MKYLGEITDNNDLVTKKYVDDAVSAVSGGAVPATATPLMDGTAAVGTALKYAREDHVHPSDTTKADVSSTISNVAYNSTNKTITKTINGTTSDVATVLDSTSVPTFTTPTIYSSRCKSLSGGYYKVGKLVYVQLQGTNNSAYTTTGRQGRQYMSGFPKPATTERAVLPVIWDAHQGMMANITSTGALYLCNDDGLSFEADKVFFITGTYFTSD